MSASTGKTVPATTATVNTNAQMGAANKHANVAVTKNVLNAVNYTNLTAKQKTNKHGLVAKLADALDLGSSSSE